MRAGRFVDLGEGEGESNWYEGQLGGLSSVSLAADSSLCGGSLLAARSTKPPLKGEVPAIGGRRGSSPQRLQVAAALSAAVTTTQPTVLETRPSFRRNQAKRNAHPERQPLFGREGSGGRGASLREAASPPSASPASSLREGARGRGLLYREAPSLAKPRHSSALLTAILPSDMRS